MEHFEMSDNKSSPTSNKPPDNVEKFERPRRQKAFDSLMDDFVEKYLSLFQLEKPPKATEKFGENLLMKFGEKEIHVKGTVDENRKTTSFSIITGSQQVMVTFATASIQSGKAVQFCISGTTQIVKITAKPEELPDDTRNYVLNFLQYYFVMKFFRDTIKEGDINRINICLKLLIPLFFQHSKLSKYLVECMDYILKTEVMLTPKMSLKVRAGSFVNRKGREGKNKPADMEKENQVKFLKDLIRGLGTGKSEETVVKVSKAGPIIQDIVSIFDKMAGIFPKSSGHKSKSSEEDLNALYENLRRERPLKKKPGRTLESFHKISCDPFDSIDRDAFVSHILKTAERLTRSQVEDGEEEETEECV